MTYDIPFLAPHGKCFMPLLCCFEQLINCLPGSQQILKTVDDMQTILIQMRPNIWDHI